jgi:hypothetical protein
MVYGILAPQYFSYIMAAILLVEETEVSGEW